MLKNRQWLVMNGRTQEHMLTLLDVNDSDVIVHSWRTGFVYPKSRLLTEHIWESCQVSLGPFLWFCIGVWVRSLKISACSGFSSVWMLLCTVVLCWYETCTCAASELNWEKGPFHTFFQKFQLLAIFKLSSMYLHNQLIMCNYCMPVLMTVFVLVHN